MNSSRPPASDRRLHVIQGSFEVAKAPDVCMTTILGSCVAACLWDPEAGVGGMNHFLLPQAPENASAGDRRYGVQSMELLINALLRMGARRDRLQAKVFGGARMSERMMDIGARNAEFVRRFLADESIPIANASLGGGSARRVQFWPASGRARQHMVEGAAVVQEERRAAVSPPTSGGEVELF